MFVRPMESIGSGGTLSDRVNLGDTLHSYALEDQVQGGLNLVMELKSPAQMAALLATVAAHLDEVRDALVSLHHVHSWRFLPTRDGTFLQAITVFDGDFRSYVMDFVILIADVFDAILVYIKDSPPLPVRSFPREFMAWVEANNLAQFPVGVAYPDMTTIDILTARRRLQ